VPPQWPRGLGPSSVEIVGSNPAGGDGCLSAVSVVLCQGVQNSLTDCGASLCVI